MDTYQVIGLAAAASIGVFLSFVGILTIIQRRRTSAERLQALVAPTKQDEGEGQAGLMADLDRWMERRSFGSNIARDLAQADLKLTVAEYVLLHFGLCAIGLLVGPLVLGSAVAGVVSACILMMVPKLYVANAQHKRLQSFNEQLPNALSSLSNSLRGGYGLVQAMALVASETPPPLSTEFQRVVSEVSYGLPYDTAFKNMLRRNPSADLSLVVTAIEINLEMGGNLSEILDNISAIIRDRVRIQGQIRAYTAQVRFSALVLTVMPFGIAALLYMVNKSYISMLWTTTGGLMLLAVAGVMMGLGSYMLRKMSTIDV